MEHIQQKLRPLGYLGRGTPLHNLFKVAVVCFSGIFPGVGLFSTHIKVLAGLERLGLGLQEPQ